MTTDPTSDEHASAPTRRSTPPSRRWPRSRLDVAEHPAVYEAVHRVLRDQLAGTGDSSPPA